MKSINPSPLHFISSPLKVVKDEPATMNRSPYLRALLSGKVQASKQEMVHEKDRSDRAAASRYIRDSKILRNK